MRALALLIALAACGKHGELILRGDVHQLRARDATSRASSPERPPILIVALDGVSRRQLYQMLRAGELPNLAELLGGDGFAHAHFDDTLLATMPSTTMPAWTTTFTGVTPAEHGVTGNEFFIRETRTFASPAPVSFTDSKSTLEIYTDNYLDHLIPVPTLYERVRARDPDALIWVVMNHVHRGADALILPKRRVLVKAFDGFVKTAVTGKEPDDRDLYAALDTGGLDSYVDRLASGPLPDLTTLYLYGPDLYAHVSPRGPDDARHGYLREVLDPAFGKLVARLRQRGLLERMWVVVVADHGHTEVPRDPAHAFGSDLDGPVAVLKSAGFHVRPFKRDVPRTEPFDAVLAYGGATAYVYLADRSRCPNGVCAWEQPARSEDVMAAAEAFYRANASGDRLKGALDLILVREPRPINEVDLPFEVYVGDGKTMPIGAYLQVHPHPSYVATVERLHDLAVGTHGERAGDLMLLAHSGDTDQRDRRYYFAAQYHSWHGSPSRDDSEIPLIVAQRHASKRAIAERVKAVIGEHPCQQKVTDLVLALRGR